MGLHFQEGASILPEGMQFVFPIDGTSGGTARESNTVVDYSKATALQLTALRAPARAKIVDGETPLTDESLALPPETSQVLVVFQSFNVDEIVQAMTVCLDGVTESRGFSLALVLPTQKVLDQCWESLADFLDAREIGVCVADDVPAWVNFRAASHQFSL